MTAFTTSDFDFALPPELIAQYPAAERSASRLLDGSGAQPVDRVFRDLPALLNAGDLLVFNDTQVVNARLFGEKPSGGKLELLIERVLPDGTVAAHMKVSKKPPVGTVLRMDGGFAATLLGRWPDAAGALFHLRLSGDAYAIMAAQPLGLSPEETTLMLQEAWLSRNSGGSACNQAAGRLHAQNLLTETDIWRRARQSIERRQLGSARAAVAILDAVAADLVQALFENPQRHLETADLSTATGRELAVLATAGTWIWTRPE